MITSPSTDLTGGVLSVLGRAVLVLSLDLLANQSRKLRGETVVGGIKPSNCGNFWMIGLFCLKRCASGRGTE